MFYQQHATDAEELEWLNTRIANVDIHLTPRPRFASLSIRYSDSPGSPNSMETNGYSARSPSAPLIRGPLPAGVQAPTPIAPTRSPTPTQSSLTGTARSPLTRGPLPAGVQAPTPTALMRSPASGVGPALQLSSTVGQGDLGQKIQILLYISMKTSGTKWSWLVKSKNFYGGRHTHHERCTLPEFL